MKRPQYYLMPIGSLIQYLMPRWLALRFAWLLVRLLFPLLGTQRRVIAENYRHILGRDLTQQEADDAARRVMRNFATCMADTLRAPILTRRRGLARLVVHAGHRAEFDAARHSGQAAILATGHLGNWDLAGVFVACEGYPIAAVFERIPRGMSDAFNRFRGTSGMGLIGWDERDKMDEAIRTGKFFALLSDRDLKGRGVELPWFNGRRTFPRGAAAFALRYRVPILVACFVLEPGDRHHRYRLEVDPPLEFQPSGDQNRDNDALTALVVKRLEQMTRTYPDQWFVFQPMWVNGKT